MHEIVNPRNIFDNQSLFFNGRVALVKNQPDECPLEISNRLPQSRGARIAIILVAVGYGLFPIASGTWFDDRVECFHMWSEAVKFGFSFAAYLGLGGWAWRWLRPDVVTADGFVALSLSSVFLGLLFGANVIHKCWWLYF